MMVAESGLGSYHRGKEADFYVDYAKVEYTTDRIRNVSVTTLSEARDAIHNAIKRLNSVKGFKQYVGELSAAPYDDAFDSLENRIEKLADAMDDKAILAHKYEDGSLGSDEFFSKNANINTSDSLLTKELKEKTENMGENAFYLIGYDSALLRIANYAEESGVSIAGTVADNGRTLVGRLVDSSDVSSTDVLSAGGGGGVDPVASESKNSSLNGKTFQEACLIDREEFLRELGIEHASEPEIPSPSTAGHEPGLRLSPSLGHIGSIVSLAASVSPISDNPSSGSPSTSAQELATSTPEVTSLTITGVKLPRNGEPTSITSSPMSQPEHEQDAGSQFDPKGQTHTNPQTNNQNKSNPQNRRRPPRQEESQKQTTPQGGYTSAPSTAAPPPSVGSQTRPPTTDVQTKPATVPSTVATNPATVTPINLKNTKTTPNIKTNPPTRPKEPIHAGVGYTDRGEITVDSGPSASPISEMNVGASAIARPKTITDTEQTIDEIIKGTKYTRVPTSEKPIFADKSGASSPVIPAAAGISVAAAAGVGAKAYIDYKKAKAAETNPPVEIEEEHTKDIVNYDNQERIVIDDYFEDPEKEDDGLRLETWDESEEEDELEQENVPEEYQLSFGKEELEELV